MLTSLGLDVSGEVPKGFDPDPPDGRYDRVITMGCGDACPVYLGASNADWQLEDPKGQDEATVRRIVADIDDRSAGYPPSGYRNCNSDLPWSRQRQPGARADRAQGARGAVAQRRCWRTWRATSTGRYCLTLASPKWPSSTVTEDGCAAAPP